MKNKFNIPVLYNNETLGGNYIDHYPHDDGVIVKRRIISKDDGILIEFGICILESNKNG